MYDLKTMPFLALSGRPQVHVTEGYVAVPPALTITDERGDVWSIGFVHGKDGPNGELSFDVVKNGQPTGDFTSRIEMRGNRVRILQRGGRWLYWNGRSFV